MKKIAIHSVPRSGSSWLGCIFDSSSDVIYRFQPLFSYAFKGDLSPTSSLNDINSFYEKIAASDDDFITQKASKLSGDLPIFSKKSKPENVVYKEVRYHHILQNLLEKDNDIKIIGLVRNPLEVLNSWIKAPREFRKDLGWALEAEWRTAPSKNQNRLEEYFGFEKWKEATEMYLRLEKEYSQNFKIVKYDDLNNDTIKTIQSLFSFCGLKYEEATSNFINDSKSLNKKSTYAVFKSKTVEKQKIEELNGEIISTIQNELKGTSLAQFLYNKD